MDGLLELLAADAVAVGDGGGKAYAAREPIHGGQRVAAFLVRLFEQGRRMGARLELTRVNGQPGVLAYDGEGRLLTVLSLDDLSPEGLGDDGRLARESHSQESARVSFLLIGCSSIGPDETQRSGVTASTLG
ncbi:MAG TPA: hypothetical protein VFI35_13165 [Actinomycetota bacterium]|nr:hypothetical protein [Actinomycetota bacterium]